MGTRRAYTDPVDAPFEQHHKWVRWTKKMRERFLDHLAATCNVRESAGAAGVNPGSVYTLRRRDPAFAAAWEDALALGYQMLETRAIGHVLAGGVRREPLDCGVESTAGPIDFDSAVRLLTVHRNAVGKPRKGGREPRFATRDETDAMLLKRLKAIETRRAREAEWAAQVEAGRAALMMQDAGADAPVSACAPGIDHAPQEKAACDGA